MLSSAARTKEEKRTVIKVEMEEDDSNEDRRSFTRKKICRWNFTRQKLGGKVLEANSRNIFTYLINNRRRKTKVL